MIRRSTAWLWMVAAVLILLPGASAASDDVRNAAYWYDQALEDIRAMSDELLIAIQAYAGDGGEPTPEVRALLRSVEPTLSLLRRGASQQYSDYELDFSEGFELRLLHLGQLRTAAKLMRAEALVKIHDGDVVGGSRDLASMYRIGGHMSDDRILISALVGQAIFAYADDSVQNAIDRGAIDSVAAAELAPGVQQLDPDDPFGYIESIFSEQELITSSLEQILTDDVQAQTAVEALSGKDGPEAEAILAQLHANGIEGEMEFLDATMNEVVEIFLLDDEAEARERLDAFEERIESGDSGLLALMLLPAYGKVYENLVESRAMVGERRAMLEQLAQGELDPQSLMNAAVLYQQAFEALRELPDEHRDAIADTSSEQGAAIEDEAVVALEEAAPVVELIRKASRLRRCDFEPVRRYGLSLLLPDHVLGMHDLLELIVLEAHYQVQAGNAEAAADRLAIGYRAVAHLGTDDALLSALIAHQAFDELSAHLRAGLLVRLLDEHRPQLQGAVQWIPRRDPFGYINAVVQTRDALNKRLRRLTSQEQGFDRKAVEELVGNWQGDEMLFVLTVLETLDENDRERQVSEPENVAKLSPPTLAERLSSLEDAVSMEAVEQVQLGIGDLAPRLSMGSVDLITGLAIPSIGNWRQRMRRARVDLRAVYELLEVDEQEDSEASDESVARE